MDIFGFKIFIYLLYWKDDFKKRTIEIFRSLEVGGLEKGCYASPSLGELLEWTVAIEGPRGTPYEGGVFFVQLVASQEHPVFPPRVSVSFEMI